MLLSILARFQVKRFLYELTGAPLLHTGIVVGSKKA
jgi:hypothetical protein